MSFLETNRSGSVKLRKSIEGFNRTQFIQFIKSPFSIFLHKNYANRYCLSFSGYYIKDNY